MSRTFEVVAGKRLTNGVTLAHNVKTAIGCARACRTMTCVAFNIQRSPAFVCELVAVPADVFPTVLVNDPSWSYFSIVV